jgi:Uma2 family endonuclease
MSMTAAKKLQPVSVEDYLSGELASPEKHEYLGGIVYAMAGASNVHNLIATNITIAIGSRLRGKRCRPFNSDTKIRVRLSTHLRFYYPDCSVICRPNPQDDSFQDDPAVIFEVISQSTRRIDTGEKKDAYLTIPSLSAYVLVEQETAAAVVYRRTDEGFVAELYEGMDADIPLPEIDAELPLAEVFSGVEFTPEATPEDLR